MRKPFGKWEILLDWINRGLVTNHEQGRRVIDRLVNTETKSPHIKEARELSKRFRKAA